MLCCNSFGRGPHVSDIVDRWDSSDTISKSENPPPPGTLKISLQFLYYFIHIHRPLPYRGGGVHAENMSPETVRLKCLSWKQHRPSSLFKYKVLRTN
jgi:hypothetical protein